MKKATHEEVEKSLKNLSSCMDATSTIIRSAGHNENADQLDGARSMVEQWIGSTKRSRRYHNRKMSATNYETK